MNYRAALLALVAPLAASTLGVVTPTPTTPAEAAVTPPQPNIVLVTVDDMRADDIYVMSQTQELLGQLELTDFISNHPLCCPARAELLTGQFGQNNGVHHNNGQASWAGYKALKAKDDTFARWFQRAGYRTTMIGKFINGWNPNRHPTPAGWTRFTPFTADEYSAYDYSYLDGTRSRPAPDKVHTNDFVTQRTQSWIRAAETRDSKPFLVWASYVAPHTMSTSYGAFRLARPALRHRGDLDGVVPLSEAKPSYEEPTEGETERAVVADTGSDTTTTRARAGTPTVRELNQSRLESLLSVDEGVASIVAELERRGELDRTVVVFTSDNGYLLGEHGEMGKNSWWDESLRVPFLARGPGVGTGPSAKGSMIVDIAPSLAALAGVRVTRDVDGRSDLFATSGGWGDDIGTLIQGGSLKNPWMWRGTRTSEWTYTRARGPGTLLFDRVRDPYQLHNLAGTGEPEEQRLARLTPALNAN